MENWKLELQLTLQNACFISFAKYLWNQADTKNKIENFFQDTKPYYGSNVQKRAKLQRGWSDIESHVLSKVNEIVLPGELRSELKLLIILLGDKIRNWLEFVVEKYNLDASSAMNIPWTAYGTINKMKVVLLLKNTNIENCRNRFSCMHMNEVEHPENAVFLIDEMNHFHYHYKESLLATQLDYFETTLILATNNLLPKDEMERFVEKFSSYILAFYLLNYGFQKLFYLIFRNVEEFLTADHYCHIILAISQKNFFLLLKKSAAIDIRQDFVESAFLLLWTEIPSEIKNELILGSRLWFCLVRASDTVIWKFIYNDKNLQCYKTDMHSNLKEALHWRIHVQTGYTFPESYFDSIEVKQLICILDKLLWIGDFYSADILTFLTGYSDEEITNVKSQLDSSRICNYFIRQHKLDEIDQFLKWRFDPEEAEIFKNQYKTNDFIYKVLLEFWSKHDKLTAFLLWLFESEENIVKYKTENPEIARKLLTTLFNFKPKSENPKFIPHYEAFMKYWLLSSEHISDLKEYLAKCVD